MLHVSCCTFVLLFLWHLEDGDLKIVFFAFPPDAPHPNRQNRRVGFMRGRLCFVVALNAFGCLHSSNRLDRATHSCLMLVSFSNSAGELKSLNSGKKQHKHELFGPDFLRTFLTLTPECPGVKSFSPSPGPQENALFGADVHDFRRGRPWPEGLLKNFVQKQFALIFWPLLIHI